MHAINTIVILNNEAEKTGLLVTPVEPRPSASDKKTAAPK